MSSSACSRADTSRFRDCTKSATNYCRAARWSQSKTNDVVRHARLAAALIRSVRDLNLTTAPPEFIVTAFTNGTVLSELAALGVNLTAVSQTAHYPFPRWPHPRVSESTANTMNLADFVGTGVGFQNNNALVRQAMNEWPHIQRSGGITIHTSEASTFRFAKPWDANVITPSVGGALQFARDWGELVHETVKQLAVRHDAESLWFGTVFFNTVV